MQDRIAGNDFLKVRFRHHAKDVIMTVLCQDERTRYPHGLQSLGGFSLCSLSYPEVASNKLYVRGLIKSKDSITVSKRFYSRGEARRYIETFTKIIDDFVKEKENYYKARYYKTITITTDNVKTVKATLYDDTNRAVKISTAMCSPESKFNFESYARLAFDKLFIETPEENLNTEMLVEWQKRGTI